MEGEELDRVKEALFILQATTSAEFSGGVAPPNPVSRVPEAEIDPTIGFARRRPAPSFALGIYKLLWSTTTITTVPLQSPPSLIHRRRRRLRFAYSCPSSLDSLAFASFKMGKDERSCACRLPRDRDHSLTCRS
jgi:hypothetical protein